MSMTDTTRSDAAERLAVHFAGPRAADEIHDLWHQLLPDEPVTSLATFDPSQVAQLPDAARRWLTHAVMEGTPLARAVVAQMHGRIRVKRWIPFHAVQLHVPPSGYLWMARAGRGPATIRGYDSYVDGIGEMRWRLLGRLPLVHATGSDVNRSAAGRVALDAFTVPTAWLTASTRWQGGPTPDSAIARWRVGDQTLRTEIRVAPNGALQSLRMPRWGAPGKEQWGEWPCGGSTDDERQFGGITIPTRLDAGYFFGTPRWTQGEFFRATITDAQYL